PGPFAQIITNFLVNSTVHAFDEGQEGEIKIQASAADDKLLLIYRDNGKGMTPEVLKKIYDPFFTTNKQKGTGLGMHIIYNLVTQKLKGNIKAWSETGKGVMFTVTVPLNI
ncbi:MAG: hypothetical protein HY738_03875, partial [Bacteroidia bacterium]|nr:hypothetical protein [Bacteroidia bacterium]